MIREMQKKDCATVARFWREYLDVPSATEESVTATFEKMSRDSRYCTYVAEEDGIVVGFLTFVEVLSFDDPDGYIKMNGIAVQPEYRRRGIAEQLVKRVEAALQVPDSVVTRLDHFDHSPASVIAHKRLLAELIIALQ